MPPSAFSSGTAISTVGVVDKPISTTSTPIPCKVPITILFIISPEIRASRPITIFNLLFAPLLVEFNLIKAAKAEVNFTTSSGLNPSPGLPPIVPLIPEIDFINIYFLKF